MQPFDCGVPPLPVLVIFSEVAVLAEIRVGWGAVGGGGGGDAISPEACQSSRDAEGQPLQKSITAVFFTVTAHHLATSKYSYTHDR
jgi:hypothetical protein